MTEYQGYRPNNVRITFRILHIYGLSLHIFVINTATVRVKSQEVDKVSLRNNGATGSSGGGCDALEVFPPVPRVVLVQLPGLQCESAAEKLYT